MVLMDVIEIAVRELAHAKLEDDLKDGEQSICSTTCSPHLLCLLVKLMVARLCSFTTLVADRMVVTQGATLNVAGLALFHIVFECDRRRAGREWLSHVDVRGQLTRCRRCGKPLTDG